MDPVIQNIPVRTEEGRRIREAFPSTTVMLDFSEIEKRVLAAMEEKLTEKDIAAAKFDGTIPKTKDEPCAFKRAVFRAGWDAAMKHVEEKNDA